MAVPPPPPPGPNWSCALPPSLGYVHTISSFLHKECWLIFDPEYLLPFKGIPILPPTYSFLLRSEYLVKVHRGTTKNLSDMWCSTRAEINVPMCEQTRWTNRTPNVATYELLLQCLSVWAQSLQDGRTLDSKQSYVFLFLDFNGFWREMTSQEWQKNLNFN